MMYGFVSQLDTFPLVRRFGHGGRGGGQYLSMGGYEGRFQSSRFRSIFYVLTTGPFLGFFGEHAL